MKVYYAHCKAIYYTPQEERDIKLLESLGFEVLNPNQSEHSKECEKCDNPMEYFLKLVDNCDCVAFRALPSMEIPAGVATEVTYARGTGKPIIELPSRIDKRIIDVDETRNYLKECGER